MKNLILLFAFVLVLVSCVYSQAPEEDSGLVKTTRGLLVVWNQPGNYFTIEINGKDVSPGQRQLWFNVDGRFLQVVTARIADFAADYREKKLDDAAILAAHRKWESDYIAETLQKKLDVKDEPAKLQNGKAALCWTYEMPRVADKQTARKQFYLSVVKGDYVLGINIPLVDNDDEKAIRQVLFDTLNTLKPDDKPLSLQKASDMIKKGN